MENRRLYTFLLALNQRPWLRHGLFWLVAPLLFILNTLAYGRIPEVRLAILTGILFMMPCMIATYTLFFTVFRWYVQGSRWKVVLGGLVWLAFAVGIHYAFRVYMLHPIRKPYWNPARDPNFENGFSSGTTVTVLAVVMVAAMLKLFRYWYQQAEANRQLEQETVQAELQLLKAQVHPHFLFNTLNNLYALTLKNSDQAPEVVRRLSGLLRYITEQCNAAEISLATEMTVIRNYVQLEQLRYGERLRVDILVEGPLEDHRIVPLLLLPFVENAFKHGSSEQVDQAYILLSVSIRDKTLHVHLVNTRQAINREPSPSVLGGIGLQNVRKRLNLLYPDRHLLVVEPGGHTFSVRLTIALTGGLVQTRNKLSELLEEGKVF